jgi:sugar-specific transcriptional regulator TrmB
MPYNKAMNESNSNEQLEEVLTSLDLPPISRKIYMRLLGNKSLNARMLAEALDIPRPSVYDHIRILQNKNLIIPKKQDGKLFFSANDPHHIQSLIDVQEAKYKEMKKVFGNLLPRLKTDAGSIDPKIQFFSGIEGVKSVQNDILWCKDTETYTMWSTQAMLDLLGPEYLAWHNKRRVEQNISVKVIRQGPVIDGAVHAFFREGQEMLRTVKYLPSGAADDNASGAAGGQGNETKVSELNISMSYWIYGDKVAFFDSSDELYGFIVHSKSFSNLMRLNFNILWGILK